MIVRESINFTRSGNPIETMRIGKAGLFLQIIEKIRNEFAWDPVKDKDLIPQSLSQLTENNLYGIDTKKFLRLYAEEHKNKNSVIREILKEIMDKVLTFNPNKLEHHAGFWVNLFFVLGRAEDIWSNPKWINDFTFNEFRQYDSKRTLEETKKLGANKAFLLGSTRGERELEIWGIENGATNLNHTYNEPIQNACQQGDAELVKLLLASPIVNPGDNTKSGKRYKSDETNFCIRRAAKEGHLEVVKLLLNDKRVNPASKANWALAAALSNENIKMCQLLLTNQRVRDNIFNMKESSIKKFNSYKGAGEL
jgi:hypothetical protein